MSFSLRVFPYQFYYHIKIFVAYISKVYLKVNNSIKFRVNLNHGTLPVHYKSLTENFHR